MFKLSLFSLSFLIFSLPLSSPAQVETYYKWHLDSEKRDQGKCIELDKGTKGKKYFTEVKREKCRPTLVQTIFEPKRGRCFEVDNQTLGKKYFNYVDEDLCKPTNISYQQGIFGDRFGCYEVDTKTMGKEYYQYVSTKKCKQDNKELFWKATEEKEGDCYTKNQQGEYKKISAKYCKPEQTTYKFYRRGPTRGDCYEQDSTNSKLFSIKTSTKDCRPEKTIYLFYKEENSNRGDCYELDEETKGDLYLNRVRIDLCKQ